MSAHGRSGLQPVGNNDGHRLRLEAENDASVVPKVALVGVLPKGVPESRENIINLRWPDCYRLGQRDVESSANDEIPAIVAGVCRSGADILASFHEVVIGVGMSSAEEHFNERFEVLRAIFNDGTYIIGKQVTAGAHGTTGWTRAIGSCRKIECPGGGHISLEVRLDSQPVIDVNGNSASAAIQREAAEGAAVLRIKPHIGVIERHFYFGVVLRERG